ncbi:hypothetical protein LGL55_18790 [Clostridium tagluense]|uniref:hypothetical protein n=1 Tax=Clostridium tagluense TaxID=360422 RepID=UPI001C0D9AB8|nr:hypothetical protein [Clostridium tagluense]MBU3129991.1 hypothetical protein [Clostridium tagluense]MCB2311895.1 hypothetical protein [Clostridium tagluense]MCB2317352.1 hypothetical protein [Clostridium tagluense]MCB2322857.1 hypothetical protein [Clostridium tagluense]MCB2326906.1 hypothetical protein [Clostridium tagluense]
MTLKIIIVINIILIISTLIFCIINFKNEKKYLYKMLMLIGTFVIQTGIVAGFILKQNVIEIAVVSEVLYLIYFMYKINTIYKVTCNS